MKTDYPELEGKIVTFIYNGGTTIQGKVIGVSYHAGITVVDVDDPKNFIVCLNKKIHSIKGCIVKSYRGLFYEIVKGLKEGSYVLNKSYRYYTREGNGTNTNCAFR